MSVEADKEGEAEEGKDEEDRVQDEGAIDNQAKEMGEDGKGEPKEAQRKLSLDKNRVKQSNFEETKKKKEEEDANKEKEYSDLVARLDMEKDDQKDKQAFVALQAGWDSSLGEVTIFGKITQDFGTLLYLP